MPDRTPPPGSPPPRERQAEQTGAEREPLKPADARIAERRAKLAKRRRLDRWLMSRERHLR